MDRETQKTMVRRQRAGYELLARLQVEQARKATFEDRVRDFNNVLGLARVLQMKEPGREDDDEVTERWSRIRARYAATR
ncbi:MAG: hypothetical protein FJX72_08950 [Armatimonadetes bacterium]|nr:hypothetical protein [Armatimonadota bacterium]